MIGKYFGGFGVMAAALCVAAPAHATGFVFTGSGLSGSYGNSFTPAAVDGITVTATAWSTADLSASSTPNAAYLGRYTGGLGVINTNEGDGSDNNSHTVDNVGSYDFIRLIFSQAVNLTGMTLNPYPVTGGSATDTDAWVSYGGNGTFNTSALWQGYITRGVAVNSGTNYSSSNFSTVWLIGAARTDSNRNDGFKLATVNVVRQVPEPATWMMMIAGFGLIGAGMRRRSVKVAFANPA